MKLNNNQQAFLAFVKAGLWEKEVRLLQFEKIDYTEVFRIAEEQSVIGLIAAAFEQVVDVKVPKEDLLTFAGRALQLEHQNTAMNRFIEILVDKLKSAGITFVLVKGQGVAQCYERPLWRACGDVDLLLDAKNYEHAKNILTPYAEIVEPEEEKKLHFALRLNSWEVELHGTLHGGWSKRVDRIVDELQKESLLNNSVRIWKNNKVEVPLPSPNINVIFVFSHILQHFFRGGIGLRQICDWCRLLWKYKNELDHDLLKNQLCEMRLVSEWKAFASLAVDKLGVPIEIMPLYSSAKCWSKKANKILSIIFETGSFGHNKDNSYYEKYPYLITKAISLKHHTYDIMRQFMIFPWDSVLAWRNMIIIGMKEIKEKKYKR